MIYTLPSQEITYEGANKKLHKTFALLSSSTRATIAHLNNNSFSIQWYKLSRNDDYNMASAAYSPDMFGIAMNIHKDLKGEKYIFPIYVTLGEDLMFGSYVLVKFNAEENIDEFRNIIFAAKKENDLAKKVITSGKNYFDFCVTYGIGCAKGVITV